MELVLFTDAKASSDKLVICRSNVHKSKGGTDSTDKFVDINGVKFQHWGDTRVSAAATARRLRLEFRELRSK